MIVHENEKGIFSEEVIPFIDLELDFFEFSNGIATYISYGTNIVIIKITMKDTDVFVAKEYIREWNFNKIEIEVK